MCKGLDDWAKREQEKGVARGKIESIKSIMESMKTTAEDAMNLLKIPVEEQAEYLAKL